MKRILAAGTARSGTTLLRDILMAHPRGIAMPETHFFNETDEEILFSDDATAEEKWNHLKSGSHVQVLANIVDPDTLDELIHESNDRIDLFLNVMDHYASGEQAGFWVEKTPPHLTRFPRLFQANRSLYGVIITRNPLDTCASLLRQPWTPDDVEQNAKRWLADNILATLLVDALPETITLIHYEDLVTEPREEIMALCEFLNIEFDEAMLHPEEHEQRTFRWENWKDNSYEPINDSSIGKYKQRLDRDQIDIIKAITAPLSNQLHDTDYPLTSFWKETHDVVRDNYEEKVQSLTSTSSNRQNP